MTASKPSEQEQQKLETAIKSFLGDKLQTQLDRDVKAWQDMLLNQDKGANEIVTKVFCVLHVGALIYRPRSVSSAWLEWKHPIASALSHGGRIIVQLPQADTTALGYTKITEHDDTFWNWLTGGVGGREKAKFQKRVATHGLTVLATAQDCPGNSKKYLKEEKGFTQPLAPRNVGFVGNNRDEHHRHWGMDLALFGMNQPRLVDWMGNVDGDGSDGHMYLYYMAPKPHRRGGLLLGCEGSRAQVYDAFGHYHSALADSSDISPTGGSKWRLLGEGPMDAKDDLFVDLTGITLDTLIAARSNFNIAWLDQPPAGKPGGNADTATFIPKLTDWKKMTAGTALSVRSSSSIGSLDKLIREYESMNKAARKAHLPKIEAALDKYQFEQESKEYVDSVFGGRGASGRYSGSDKLWPLINQERILLDVPGQMRMARGQYQIRP